MSHGGDVQSGEGASAHAHASASSSPPSGPPPSGPPPSGGPPSGGPPSGGPPRRSLRWRVLGWIAAGLAVVLVVASLAAYLKFRAVWDSIRRVSVAGLGPQPPKLTNALNVLVIGSDSRAGTRGFGAGVTGERSDTIMVLHIAPRKRGVIVLSIPRDSVAPILSCPPEPGAAGQLAQPGQVEQINATFAHGGPGCLFKTIEQTTRLHLDHFIQLDFTGFQQVINDLGGVSICLPFAINDPLSNLHLSAGRHHVYGREALAFWRARYIGEGSDLQRIRRDQYLMVSMLQGVEHSNLLFSPTRIVQVMTDAARSMTTDTGLSLPGMIGIVESLHQLPPGSVQFIELPTVPYPPNPSWVTWPAADTGLFSAMARGQAIRPTARVAGGDSRRAQAVADATSAESARSAGASNPPPQNLSRSYGGITGSTNVCKDNSAFAGPRGGA